MSQRRRDNRAGYSTPSQRPLRIYPFDPMLDRSGRTVVANLAYEKLLPGPTGRLVEVVDYDASADTFYEPVDLEHPSVLINDGLDPDDADPRFHQLMVYAVSMRVLETFERALGRAFRWRGNRRLRIYPHAFRDRNAYFDSELGGGALAFGYFAADETDPGDNIPGQTIFTCLSHQIVAHETAHAVLHRLRPHFSSPTNPDVRAFHEGFADIVAYLMTFTYPELVSEEIARNRGVLAKGTPLLDLAAQFGFSSGSRKALRTAVEKHSTSDYTNAVGPHARGQVLAAAVMDGFLRCFKSEAASAVRLATGRQGLPEAGELHPDLIASIARAATKSAERVLRICIRAIDYLPPVDVTFSDYLRAIVTSDRELFPADANGIRAALIEGFRRRGIYPTGSASLAERSIQFDRIPEDWFPWTPGDSKSSISGLLLEPELMLEVAQEFDRRAAMRFKTIDKFNDEEDAFVDSVESSVEAKAASSSSADVADRQAMSLHRFAKAHARRLALDKDVPIRVESFHASQHLDAEGYVRSVIAVQYSQTRRVAKDLGGLAVRGGTTVIANSLGEVSHVISKQVPAETDLDDLERHIASLEHQYPELAWDPNPSRIVNHLSLQNLDNERF